MHLRAFFTFIFLFLAFCYGLAQDSVNSVKVRVIAAPKTETISIDSLLTSTNKSIAAEKKAKAAKQAASSTTSVVKKLPASKENVQSRPLAVDTALNPEKRPTAGEAEIGLPSAAEQQGRIKQAIRPAPSDRAMRVYYICSICVVLFVSFLLFFRLDNQAVRND